MYERKRFLSGWRFVWKFQYPAPRRDRLHASSRFIVSTDTPSSNDRLSLVLRLCTHNICKFCRVWENNSIKKPDGKIRLLNLSSLQTEIIKPTVSEAIVVDVPHIFCKRFCKNLRSHVYNQSKSMRLQFGTRNALRRTQFDKDVLTTAFAGGPYNLLGRVLL